MVEICPTCGGRGDIKIGDTRQTCSQCNGTGVIETPSNSQAASVPPAVPGGASHRIAWPMILLGLLAALTLVSALAVFWLILQFPHGTPISINNQNSNGNTIITINGATPTPTGTVQQSQTPANQTTTPNPTQTGGGPTPSATASTTPSRATPTRTPTHTPTPIPAPFLFVSPQSIHLTVCVAGSSTFMAGNHGGGTLHWTTKANNALYQVAPTQGSLGTGQTQTVQVTNITLNGSISVSSNGGAATVYITCG
jgi:hypothetical protein